MNSHLPSRTKFPDWQMQNRAWLLYLPMTQRGMAFCPAKTEGRMIWLPADVARGTCFLLHREAASELDPISKIYLGINLRALSQASSVFLRSRDHRREAPSSTSSPHQKCRRSSFARAPSRSQFGDSFLREPRLALVSRLGSSKSWLRQPFFEAYRKILRKLLMGHLTVVLGLTLNVHRCSLARAKGPLSSYGELLPRAKGTTGRTVPGVYTCSLARAAVPFSSHGSFCLVRKGNGRAYRPREVRGGTISFLNRSLRFLIN